MRTLKITIEYDGTRYSGWQQQANAQTIAGELWTAAEDFFGRSVEIGGSGRTDAGVHAIAQIAHIKFPRWGASSAEIRNRISGLTPQEIIYGLNDRLPTNINVLAVEDASATFHARHDATSRSYFYQISTRRTAFGKKQVWWIKDKLNVRAMADAAEFILGRHDFSAFSERDVRRVDESTVVVVNEAQVVVEDHLIIFRISASHFLWKMVRRLVGSLVEVGRGNVSVEEFARAIENPQAKSTVKSGVKLLAKSTLDPARVTAPPSGLFLETVTYPEIVKQEFRQTYQQDSPPREDREDVKARIKLPLRKAATTSSKPIGSRNAPAKLPLRKAATTSSKPTGSRKSPAKLPLRKDIVAGSQSGSARKVHVKLSLKEAAAHIRKSRKQD
ncbi:MAG: tRNA pseudouridine(38-40) synthase TruA [Acidobacteriota bacterium]